MSVTHYLSAFFARPNWRKLLFVGLVLHLLVGAYGLYVELDDKSFSLSTMGDVVQYGLIQAALILLFVSSGREEKVRYSMDTRFYLEQYPDEKQRFLVWQRNAEENSQVRMGVDESTKDRLGREAGLVISQSVLIYRPAPGATIESLRFELQDTWYEPPWMVSDQALDIILKRFNALEQFDYNGLTLATKGLREDADGLTLEFHKSCFYSYLATNMVPEVRLPGGLPYRMLLEPGPHLNTLETSLPENHLGLSCLMRTSDGYLLIPLRGQNTNVFKGHLSPSVSGAANISTCSDKKYGGYSPHAWLLQETREELPFFDNYREAFPTGIANALRHAYFLGMTRELRRCGKPEVFFFYPLPLDSHTLKTSITQHQKATASSTPIQAARHNIDWHENEAYLVIREQDVFTALDTRQVRCGSRWHQKIAHHSILTYQGKTYNISESLLVNLLLYRIWRQAEKEV